MQLVSTFAEVIKRFAEMPQLMHAVDMFEMFSVGNSVQATKYYTINYDNYEFALKDDFTPIVDYLVLSSIII